MSVVQVLVKGSWAAFPAIARESDIVQVVVLVATGLLLCLAATCLRRFWRGRSRKAGLMDEAADPSPRVVLPHKPPEAEEPPPDDERARALSLDPSTLWDPISPSGRVLAPPASGARATLSLIGEVFAELDEHGAGWLTLGQLLPLAEYLGFKASTWHRQYLWSCEDLGCNPLLGMDVASFERFLRRSVPKAPGYCTVADLESFLAGVRVGTISLRLV